MENKVGTVFVDFDGVITNSAKRIIEMLNEKFKTDYSADSHNYYNFEDLFPRIKQSDLNDVFADKDFFNDELEIIDDCLETLCEHSNKFNFTVVSHGISKNLTNKETWINKKLPHYIKYVGVPTTQSKSIVDMSKGIMIDDNLKVLLETNAKIKILFVPYGEKHYNKIKPYDNVYVVHTWKQVNDILSFYERINQII